MRLIDFDKIPFLEIPIAPVVKGESVHYEQGALKEWFDGTQDVEAVTLDRIKQLREEINNLDDGSQVWGILANAEDSDIDAITEKINEYYRAMIFPLIDKLIEEVEGEE